MYTRHKRNALLSPALDSKYSSMNVLLKFSSSKRARVSASRSWTVPLTLDKCHVTLYNVHMIKTFADRRTQEFYEDGKSNFPSEIWKRRLRKLGYLDAATVLDDLKVPPGNRLHKLKGNRAGQHSISINDQWRICFRFFDGDTYDVEITDYH